MWSNEQLVTANAPAKLYGYVTVLLLARGDDIHCQCTHDDFFYFCLHDRSAKCECERRRLQTQCSWMALDIVLRSAPCLQSEQRWACSGTPVTTNLRDLDAQLEILHAFPLSINALRPPCFTRATVKYRLERQYVFEILGRMMIRHTKAALHARGESIIPAKKEQFVPVHLTPEDMRVYTHAHARIREAFDKCLARGLPFCKQHTVPILAMLAPLRRLCSGALCEETQLAVTVPGDLQLTPRSEHGGAPCFPSEEDAECPVCLEVYEQPTRTPCGHWFCFECITNVLRQRDTGSTCPLCRARTTVTSLRAARYPAEGPSTDTDGYREGLQLHSKLAVRHRS